jgi:hypothetical protein
MGTYRGEYILMWLKNLFRKRKHSGKVDLEKVKSDYGSPHFTLYEPLTERIIALDTVQPFVIYEEDVKVLHSIEEQGFSLEGIGDNWWVCRRKK